MLIYRFIVLFLGSIVLMVSHANAQYENQAIILQYHHVSTQTPPSTSLSPAAFGLHLDYLEQNAFTILPLEDVIQGLRNGTGLPDKAAVITFDDAYTSVYDVAYPLLKERNWPYTIFVTTDLVESNDNLYATWEQIREMAGTGATIANHTVDHPYLLDKAGMSDTQWIATIRTEITSAEEAIINQTGQNHKLLAYPYGEYNPEIQSLLIELGYVGIAQHSGPVNPSSDFTALPRFPFSGIYASMNAFPTKVSSLAFTMDAVTPSNPVTSSASPEAILDFSDNQEGLSQLTCYNSNTMMEIEVLDIEKRIYKISSAVKNNSRRFRYNCTAPGKNQRYYWLSIPWINPDINE